MIDFIDSWPGSAKGAVLVGVLLFVGVLVGPDKHVAQVGPAPIVTGPTGYTALSPGKSITATIATGANNLAGLRMESVITYGRRNPCRLTARLTDAKGQTVTAQAWMKYQEDWGSADLLFEDQVILDKGRYRLELTCQGAGPENFVGVKTMPNGVLVRPLYLAYTLPFHKWLARRLPEHYRLWKLCLYILLGGGLAVGTMAWQREKARRLPG